MKVFITVLITMFLVVGCAQSAAQITPLPLPEPMKFREDPALTPLSTGRLVPTSVPMRVPAVTATTQPIESAVQKVTSTTIPPYLITPQPLLYGNEVSLKVLHYALDFRSNRAQTADLNLVLELEDQSVFPQVPFQIIMHITHGQAEFVTTEDIKQVARISAKEIVFLKLSDEPIYKVSITAPVTKLVKGEIIALTLRLDSAQ